MVKYINISILCVSLCASSISVASDVTGLMGRASPGEVSDIYASGIYASGDTYGMRATSVIGAFRANSKKPFDFPISGFRYTKEMSQYKGRDSVALYADNTSPPFRKWEVIKSARYTPTSFYADGIDSSNVKKGMLIDTMHNPKWSSIVVSSSNGKVQTTGWVNTATGHLGTPPDGYGLVINPITKIWAANFNAFLEENSQSNSLVVQENGVVNNKLVNPMAVNGIDTVILPQSKHGGTAAYLARSATGGNRGQWDYGFMSQGAKDANFISYDVFDGLNNTNAAFKDTSTSKYGIVFSGKNKEASIAWESKNKIVAYIGSEGLIQKIGYKTSIIKSDANLNDSFGRYLIIASGSISLQFPKIENLIDGYTLKITKISGGDVELKSPDGLKVNGSPSFTIKEKAWNKEAIYTSGEWFIE
ncbi:hypothetical protein WP3W18E01_17670 [Raoultella ornithinolytica]|nr:hypothetical protein WP3W18E01_17670 [Raoultella ornithinolytica]SCA38538.1 Uncharacterised protein [Klebsiella quasipneumoniae]SCA40026.1 Uncharacterised protein [Klebsiella quasipneumoniae]